MEELMKCMNDDKTDYEKARRLREYFFHDASRFRWIEAVIEQTKYCLQCLYCLRDDTLPPFKPFLQLKLYNTFERRRPSEWQVQHVEYVEYKEKKLQDAFRSILNTVFGGRKCSVLVKTFSVNHLYNIRAPTDLKLKVQKLKIGGGSQTVCDPLQPIIDGTSLPFKEVSVENYHAFTPDFHHNMVKNAEKLIIGDHEEGVVWLPILLALENKIVKIKGNGTSLELDDYITLIRSCVENGKPVGTTFIFDVYIEDLVEEVLEQVAGQYQGVIKGERNVTIPMKRRNMLQISYEDNEECTLTMKVLPTSTDIAGELSNHHIE